MERMHEDRLKRIVRCNIRGVRLRERPRMGWMISVKRVLNERGMSGEQGRIIVSGRSELRSVVNARLMMQP